MKKIIIFHSLHQKKYFIFFAPTLATFILAIDHGRNISLISFHLIAFYAVLKFDLKKFEIFEIRHDLVILEPQTCEGHHENPLRLPKTL